MADDQKSSLRHVSGEVIVAVDEFDHVVFLTLLHLPLFVPFVHILARNSWQGNGFGRG
jgi:hypothetical protein